MKLQTDLQKMNALLNLRQTVRLMATACLLPLVGCGSDSKASDTGTTDGSGGIETPTGCSLIPEETAGPYPGDGSNGPNILSLSDVVRRDITSSIGTLSGTATGVPLTVRIKLVNTKQSCASLEGYAIYLWHCDKDGKYSLYNLTAQNYLRGVQVSDADGMLSFTTIFPGCYAGRMPHMHFEVYPSVAKASSSTNKINTSQIAFPSETCNEVYAGSAYSASVKNFAAISFARDNVFSDGYELQLASMSGTVGNGLVADIIVAIAV